MQIETVKNWLVKFYRGNELAVLYSDAKAIEEELDRLKKENDILRGLVAKHVPGCIYCGEINMAKCPSGFPGCGKADDIMVADCLANEELVKEGDRLKAELAGIKVLNETLVQANADLAGSLAKAREELKKIASYGQDGICPYGCDTPYIAQLALKEITNDRP